MTRKENEGKKFDLLITLAYSGTVHEFPGEEQKGVPEKQRARSLYI